MSATLPPVHFVPTRLSTSQSNAAHTTMILDFRTILFSLVGWVQRQRTRSVP
jgi:hypothetical protein